MKSSGTARRAAVALLGLAAIAGLAALFARGTFAKPSPAAEALVPAEDLLLFHGRFLESVVDSAGIAVPRWTYALLVHDGRIAANGALENVEVAARVLQRQPRRVDLRGRFVSPGLCDAHGHVSGLGFALQRLRFEGTTSAEQVAAMVGDSARARPRGEWILGRGWDQNDWAVEQFPTRDILDRVAPEHPVWLRRVDGHAGWANSRAMALAGITKATPDPPGGRIYRLADGSPSGIFVDNALALIERAIPSPSREQTRAALVRALEHCRALGLTAVHDAGIDSLQLAIYHELAATGRLPIRVFAMLSAATAMRPGMMPALKPPSGDGMFRVFAVKAYADGALGSRGAALLAPYNDDSTNTGLLVTPPDTLEAIARACVAAHYQMCTHAIGDRANRLTLEAYERAAGGAAGLNGKRFRIEHAQVIAPGDIERFARDGVIASMQPTHCTSDMPWAPARLGAKRIEGAYAWRKLMNAGALLAFGSDFPVESDDPRLGLYAAVTTSAPNGNPPEGFRPSEKLTVLEAIRAFTSNAAMAAFAEAEVGRLSVGQRADLVVWDRDLTAVPPPELLKAGVVMTVVGGRVEEAAKGK
jgi:predicted amidohydrolase YtcJ